MPPKKDQKKMSLGDFLADDKYGSWADEMEDMPTIPSTGARTGYGNRNNDGFGGGGRMGGGFGGGDRGDRYGGGEREGFSRRTDLPLPTKPPYTAHVGNLSFDATEDDISQYFEQCSISSVRLVRDKMGDRPKGFGYVEFQTLDGLKKAIELNNGQLAGRNVRVSVADPPKERQDDRTNVDTWRRSGPLPASEAPQMRRNNSRFNDSASEAGDRFERRGSGFNNSNPPAEGDGKFRDFNNWERKGPLPPSTPTDTQSESGRPPRQDRGDRRRSPATNPFDRERQPSIQGEERTERSERPRREYQRPPAPERVPTAAEKDSQWRRGARPDVPADQIKEQLKTQTQSPPQTAAPKSPGAAPSGPAKERHERHERHERNERNAPPPSPGALQTRPKLALQKRSESLAVEATPTNNSGDPKSSPFGAARPIDTTAKLKEIEEKRAQHVAEKKAQDEKVKEERKATRAAEKSEKSEKSERKGQKGDSEPETPKTGRNFELLRRTSAVTATDDVNTADLDPEEGPETKEEPKQPVKAVPKVQLPSEPATKTEGDGWSTVKRGRGANGKV